MKKLFLIAGFIATMAMATPHLSPSGSQALASAGDNTQVQYCYYYKHKAMLTGDPYWWAMYRKCLKF